MKDYYKILGVSSRANEAEIKAAYRKLALLYHRDENQVSGSEGKFRELCEAYEVLASETKRPLYDKKRQQAKEMGPMKAYKVAKISRRNPSRTTNTNESRSRWFESNTSSNGDSDYENLGPQFPYTFRRSCQTIRTRSWSNHGVRFTERGDGVDNYFAVKKTMKRPSLTKRKKDTKEAESTFVTYTTTAKCSRSASVTMRVYNDGRVPSQCHTSYENQSSTWRYPLAETAKELCSRPSTFNGSLVEDGSSCNITSPVHTSNSSPALCDKSDRSRYFLRLLKGKHKVQDPPILHDLYVSLEDIEKGCTKEVKILKNALQENGRPEKEVKTLTVHIQPGCRTGTKITFPQEGDQATDRVPADVIFIVKDKLHPHFERYGDNLKMTANIFPKEVEMLPTTLYVPTLSGTNIPVKVTKKCIKSGLKLHGYGLPSSKKANKRGSLLVSFNVLPQSKS